MQEQSELLKPSGNHLLNVIQKLTTEEKATLKGMTDVACMNLVKDLGISNEKVNASRDILFLSICSAYIYGAKRVIEELDNM